MIDQPHARESNPATPDVQAALQRNTELKEALNKSEMPLRFKAMVLGLSTLRQMNSDREGKR